jgi:outer membrane PBP1 activator LpoA protein
VERPAVPSEAPPQPEPPPVAVAPIAPPTPAPARPLGPALTLILPLEAPEFRAPAEALYQGFLAAMAVDGARFDVFVRSIAAHDDDVLAAYDAAAAAGTRVIVGPMTRSAVTTLARSGRVSVPTLALNRPDAEVALPGTFYTFSLGADIEARQAARQAWSDTMRIASVVSMSTTIDRRSRDAFIDEWLQLGGRIVDVLEASPHSDPVQVRERLEFDTPHFVFLAADGERARWLRPFLPSQLPVYSTSQVHDTDDTLKNFDLTGVRIGEMPWLVKPNDPVVARYPRPADLERELGRFYAFGIDTYRVARRLLEGERAFAFQGVTGRIVVSENGSVDRQPVIATFRDGKCFALE